MTIKDWLQILSGPMISIIAIFISNWLGRKSNQNEFKLNSMKNAYLNFHLPLMKILILANKNALTYYWIIAAWYNAPGEFKKDNDRLLSLLRSNLEYLPPEIVKLVPEYMVATSGARLFFGDNEYRENYKKSLDTASDLFDEIIKSSLQDASRLANKLGYPDISKPILESFLNIEHSQHNYPRALPEIYQTNSPRQFVGPEPPYY